MALETNFNTNPYYDDFDEDKKFLRMLFKPGYAVQARELTQLQTILQKQVSRFGDHIFKNGSVVTGGSLICQNCAYINLVSTYSSSAINVSDFDNKIIINDAGAGIPFSKKAQVLKTFDADDVTGQPKTLLVSETFGTFASADTILTSNPSDPTNAVNVYATIATSGVGNAQVFSVTEGVYYYEGFFVKVDAQTIPVSKYSNTGSARIGFEVTESIVKYDEDTSLLDPAQDASNYQAPGADRYKIVMTLASRSLASTDTTKFIELARIENGNIIKLVNTPLYSVLEETLARRTYDESGNYTVRPFNLALQTNSSNTANLDVILSPGKAYIYGHEYESIYPKIITVDKPRSFQNVNNKQITADYGYFVYANTPFGSLPINTLDNVELHCVSNLSINLQSSSTRSNTKIGNVRVKSITYDSAGSVSNSASYIYKLHLTNINVESILGGSCNNTLGGVSGNTTFIQIANVLGFGASTLNSNGIFATTNNAYTGAKFRIISGPGTGETPKTIINYNGATQTIQLDQPFVANVQQNSSTWAIDFEFNDVRSLIVTNTAGSGIVSSYNIDTKSRDPSSQFNDTLIFDTSSEKLVFNLGQTFVKDNSIADMTYTYKKFYTGITFTGTVSSALSLATGETLTYTGTSSSLLPSYYQVICTTAGGSYKAGDNIPASAITGISSGQLTITGAATGMAATIIASVTVYPGTAKTKTYKSANTTVQVYTGAAGQIDLFSAGNNSIRLFPDQGQIQIFANSVVKTPDTSQSLFTSDVVAINSVLDFAGLAFSPANEASAANITSNYILVSGQKDSYYDHSAIKLKPGFSAPTGNLLVKFHHFSSTGIGFFTGRSYTAGGYPYENIPEYSDESGTSFQLRDCLDFRAVRSNATTATANSVTFESGQGLPVSGSAITLDYDFYLPRKDKITLSKDGVFQVVKGIPSLTPVEPSDKESSMTLYKLSHDPYLINSSNTKVNYINNKRYTMRDIGTIEKRVENLEYYTSLSLLELDALNKQDLTIKDTSNLQRFKNGILVDSFTGQSIMDVTKPDLKSSIDTAKTELRPSINASSFHLMFDDKSSSGYSKTGPYLTLAGTPVTLVTQNAASRTYNINPTGVTNYIGKIDLSPKQDVWVDTTRAVDTLVNIEGDKDAWELIGGLAYSVAYNAIEEILIGTTTETVIGGAYDSGGGGRRPLNQDTTTTTSTTSKIITSGIAQTIVPQTIQQRIGDRVIDVSVIPYMRNIAVLFTASDFKPDVTLYPFFDNTLVQGYVSRANKVELEKNNLLYETKTDNYETVVFTNKINGANIASAIIVKSSNNEAFVVSIRPTAYPLFNVGTSNTALTGLTTQANNRITGYFHYSGNAAAGGASTITLRGDAAGSNTATMYGVLANCSTIYITQGTGAGQSATITAYDTATRIATITPSWTTQPDVTSLYTIGNQVSNRQGDAAGIFFIPKSTFRIGEKKFRLIDNNSNDVSSSRTNGDNSFFASGLTEKLQDTIISATVPTLQKQFVSEEKIVTSTSAVVTTNVIGWIDPLAQTFLVSPTTNSRGVFINKIRVCFKTKSTSVPVTLQIRPTVNGYPSYATIYPYASVTLTPDKVKVVTDDTPDLNDATKFTDFEFPSGVYLQPGEHSFVLIANSKDYEIYGAAVEGTDISKDGKGSKISEVPYQGLLFESQNGSTWLPLQGNAMTFRIFRNEFSTTTPASVVFKVTQPSSNTVYDTLNLKVGDLVISGTSIAYQFNSLSNTTAALVGLKSITPLDSYNLNDGFGRRVITSSANYARDVASPYEPSGYTSTSANADSFNIATSNSFIAQAVMSTTDSAVSPIIDTTNFNIYLRENIINNLPLSNNGFTIVNGGAGYTTGTVTISAPTILGGVTAEATATVTNGAITAITLKNGLSGSLYVTSPTITITGANTTMANVSYNGEDKKSGGNSDARYITRKVVLADGFDSGDLRLYLTAYKPSTGNIFVYYKILSDSDPDLFDDKNYQTMTQIDNNVSYVSKDPNDYREFTFAPGVNYVANNSVSYVSGTTTFRTFRTFAIKIVMTGTDPTDTPKIRDFRAIAIPEAL